MAAGFGSRVFGEVAVDPDAGDVVAAGAFPAGLVTLASVASFAAADSATGDSTIGGVRGDACEAAAESDATGENGTASVL